MLAADGSGGRLSERARAFSIDALLSSAQQQQQLLLLEVWPTSAAETSIAAHGEPSEDSETSMLTDEAATDSAQQLQLPEELLHAKNDREHNGGRERGQRRRDCKDSADIRDAKEQDEPPVKPDDDSNAALEPPSPPTGAKLSGLAAARCNLEMRDLWRKFYDLGTEMIITKSGRRMFPSLRVTFCNLEPEATYAVALDIGLVDNKRYRYAYHRSSWLVAGRADPPLSRRCYVHPDGPFRGAQLAKQSLSFEKVKLTNNSHDKWGYVVLNSMHKYQPRVHLIKCASEAPSICSTSDLKKYEHRTFTFPETVFIGVTAYQNQLITKLKIDSNPFAKGFRDSARITQLDRESVDLLIKAARGGSLLPNVDGPADAVGSAAAAAAAAAATAAAAAAAAAGGGGGSAADPSEAASSRLLLLSQAYAGASGKGVGADLLSYYYQAYRLQALTSAAAASAAADRLAHYNPYAYSGSGGGGS